MLKLLKTALRHRHATVAYPARPLDVDANFRGKPQYDAQQCIACGACTAACPANALTMQTDAASGVRTWALNLGRCIFCARCEEVCPTAAIVLSPEFELAVWRKEDLQQRAEFRVCRCIECGAPYAAQKEIDYAMALLVQAGHLTVEQAEARRAQFETCPACKRQHNMIPTARIALGRHLMPEASQ
ncbi:MULTISPECIES: formate hydrogenlyase complex iron-sulfur subunit [Edwardsiella]|uniref:Formate hydrogenlyase complex 3 iron-sulfur protein Formate hydrogenlyase subunit 6 Ni,Fe-hydrogenase III medium subunit n=2 Tax=Edwardsiella anguillarum TaxID=1821960 RepID=A0A076LPL5_9GAMM|nr:MULTISPECIES: formate hydrogenlyase complex iron-sulfur subunit [Edwardsiella]AKM46925.1 formate hydrogenlyase complex iron-sulfur subunit [Edwardsiella sp. EA181011]GAJ68204.1 formate hydrogenlyase complex 3 iron-sulfur protein; formate hydrogenlyase subunit 6; Ni,Fe-hydrogenase III medium subunit [Edwardsiella piscicida]AIJ07584.1 Formate hydrogenlyase complex 3 iron-sulfur protein; Formate hydrogenlyase subunit 6; Ni,Fe-hydrogenase III medium subunit [Edwardsiella anguillarum ET080813]AKR